MVLVARSLRAGPAPIAPPLTLAPLIQEAIGISRLGAPLASGAISAIYQHNRVAKPVCNRPLHEPHRPEGCAQKVACFRFFFQVFKKCPVENLIIVSTPTAKPEHHENCKFFLFRLLTLEGKICPPKFDIYSNYKLFSKCKCFKTK